MTAYEKSSAQNLCEAYRRKFIDYTKFGKIVVDVILKDEPGLREVFLNSKTEEEYEKNIKKFWFEKIR